jgi:DNA (cytosine-5)-methyltransferase 1
MKVLNLYAGLGGNRKLWPDNCQVTSVESNPQIAAVYRRLYPQDTLIEGDAHAYLLEHHASFDFIWSSPPCQTHSKMNKATRHKTRRYPDMSLYEEIIFLTHFHDGKWLVENVKPYYAPFMQPKAIGRHLFWSNFPIVADEVKAPANFINRCNLSGKRAMQEWLGIHYDENIYYGGNHCPAQILRNCVHPDLGLQVFSSAFPSQPNPLAENLPQ